MAKILVLGDDFGGIVAAEPLAKRFGRDHHITLASRSRKFLFYPALMRLASYENTQKRAIDFQLRQRRRIILKT